MRWGDPELLALLRTLATRSGKVLGAFVASFAVSNIVLPAGVSGGVAPARVRAERPERRVRPSACGA